MKNFLKNRRQFFILILLCLTIFVLGFWYLLKIYPPTDASIFGGDHDDYQSLGVNLSLGYGYREGGLTAFEVYKFRNPPLHRILRFYQSTEYRFYRQPGYPFFLAIIYKIFGIHPKVVYVIQTAILSFAVAMMPVIGFFYWSKSGALSGVLSSLILIRYLPFNPRVILTEPLIVFSLVVWVLVLMWWEAKGTRLRTMWLGITTGVLLLVKGISIFIPFFFVIYLMWRKAKMSLIFLFILAYGLMILPWSIYVSVKSHRLVVLTTQAEYVLLDCMNEDCINSGKCTPAFRKEHKGDLSYLYNRLDQGPRSYGTFKKLLLFKPSTILNSPVWRLVTQSFTQSSQSFEVAVPRLTC